MKRFVVTETITVTRVHVVRALDGQDAVDVVRIARGEHGEVRRHIARAQVMQHSRSDSRVLWHAFESEGDRG